MSVLQQDNDIIARYVGRSFRTFHYDRSYYYYDSGIRFKLK